MSRSLAAARDNAEGVRFSGDTLRGLRVDETSCLTELKALLSEEGLQVSDNVTPSLARCIDRVSSRLLIPAGALDAFVHASPELQAECYSHSDSECVVRFSSSLIDLLDEDELEFVAGHELGHFLLGHGPANADAREGTLELFMEKRAQEISADRIGLLSCKSLEVAVRALMKTVSGLSEKHLRFDIGTFLSQLRNVDDAQARGFERTHPSIVVRCRALLWFSLCSESLKGAGNHSKEEMTLLDQRVERDFRRFVDGPVRERIDEAKQDLALWLAADEIVRNGKFEKHEQEAIAEMFGVDLLERLKNFLAPFSTAEAEEAVHERMVSARAALEHAIPESFSREYESTLAQIVSRFRGS